MSTKSGATGGDSVSPTASSDERRLPTPRPWCLAGTVHDHVIAQHDVENDKNCDVHPVIWAEDDHLRGRKEDKLFVIRAVNAYDKLRRNRDRLVRVLEDVRRVLVEAERSRDLWSDGAGACLRQQLVEVDEVLGEALDEEDVPS